MERDPNYNIFVYQFDSKIGDMEEPRPYLVRVKHPKTKLHIFFEGASRSEVVDKAETFWTEYQEEREAAWAAQEAARLKRREKSK